MAKRKKKVDMFSPVSWTPEMQKKSAAQSMARTMMDTSPKHKKMEDHITQAVLAAGEKAMKKKM